MERIVVAVDLGTSRTAYATTREGLEKESIEVKAPDSAGHVSLHDVKTPTNVLLDPIDNRVVSFGRKAEEDYMKQTNSDRLFFRYFKMGLHLPQSDKPLVEAANGKKLKLFDVLTKALEHIKNCVIRKLNMKGLDVTPYDVIWVLTVPAIWNDWAKVMMRSAAHSAGMIREMQAKDLLLALEPECVCASIQSEEILGVDLCADKNIMVLDCGGGTVDITAYRIASMQPLLLEELISPHGGDLGATKIDDEFFEFMEELLGVNRFHKLRQSSNWLCLTREWEDKKVTFSGRENEQEGEGFSDLKLGDVLCELDIKSQDLAKLVSGWNSQNADKKMNVSGKTGLSLPLNLMLSFFQGPVEQIVAKIKCIMAQNKNQLADLDCVVVAGGFACCPILIDRLREIFEGTARKVVVPQHPDLAVVKGAALFGARKSISLSRKARYTYGVRLCAPFDASNKQHREHESRKYKASDGMWCLPVFDVHYRIGDDISVGMNGYRKEYFPRIEHHREIRFSVLVTKSKHIFLSDDPGIQELCRCWLAVNMSLPFKDRKFQVEFSFSGTETVLRVFRFNGREYINVKNINVQFPREVHWLSRDLVCTSR